MTERTMSTSFRLLAIPVALGLLTSCGQQPAPTKAKLPMTAQGDIDEMHADVEAAKRNPSYVDPSKAGPPIHVDPNPKSAGMIHMQSGAVVPAKR